MTTSPKKDGGPEMCFGYTHQQILERNGIVRVRKMRPRVSSSEVAVNFSMNIPDEFFIRPTIEAGIVVKQKPILTVKMPIVEVEAKDLIPQGI